MYCGVFILETDGTLSINEVKNIKWILMQTNRPKGMFILKNSNVDDKYYSLFRKVDFAVGQ